MIVELGATEIDHALRVASARDLAAHRQNRAPIYRGSNTFLGHIIGALGELTVAKALGVYWSPNVGGNDHGRGDVAGFEIRATTRQPPRLTIRERDDDRLPFVLVTGTPPSMEIEGWLYAIEAKRAEWRLNREWSVPVENLHPWSSRPAKTPTPSR